MIRGNAIDDLHILNPSAHREKIIQIEQIQSRRRVMVTETQVFQQRFALLKVHFLIGGDQAVRQRLIAKIWKWLAAGKISIGRATSL